MSSCAQPFCERRGTAWLRVTGTVPNDFGVAPGTSVELHVDLGWDENAVGFNAEGLAWRPDGSTIKGIHPENFAVPLDAAPGESFEIYVEAAASPNVDKDYTFTPTPLGSRSTAGNDPLYALRGLAIVERDENVFGLQMDLQAIRGLIDELPADLTRRADLLRAMDRSADALDPDDVAGTAEQARAALAAVLAVPASGSAHRAVAVGHSHIDSAWLWPVRETIRKCARTWSNVLDLMDRDPDFTFAASSAQQYAWMRDAYPEIFERIRDRVAEGRWIPVGSMWVESDTNLPGGEALARQFVAGKRFFLEEFGLETRDAWLPDSFGYTAAMPQIMRATGATRFLTQKPSWNDTNKLPHSSFQWEGIDGSRVITHCPPVDLYNARMSPAEVRRGERNNKERGVVDTSMLLYGFGDGGGGPTREMLALARRQGDLDGSPRVDLGRPDDVWEDIEAVLPDLPVWAGEMYLEFHRGTYTSQLRTKQGNRRSEHLLREAELWASVTAVHTGAAYPYAELEHAWHTVLLQQFHGILPGSSIAWVYEVAEANYAEVAQALEAIIVEALGALAGSGADAVTFNAAPVSSAGVAALGAGSGALPGLVTPLEQDGQWIFDTGAVRAVIDADGHLSSLVEVASGRDAIAPDQAAARYVVFRDTPTDYDAWDIDRVYQRHATELSAASVRISDGGFAVEVVREFGASSVTTRFTAVSGAPEIAIETEVDWHEHQKLLKLALPFDLRAERTASEIQFGHVERANHENTSWDYARFETSAHRWLHVAEPGFGIAVANDSTYGHDVTRTRREDGSTTTLVRESIIRAPMFPDPNADQGRHTVRTVVRVARDVLEAADSGYRLNLPVRTIDGGSAQAVAALVPLISVDSPAVFVEAVKLAEDRSGDVIVRLYEARGGRATGVRASFGFEGGAVVRTDLLERAIAAGELGADSWQAGEDVILTLRPFELVTLRITRG